MVAPILIVNADDFGLTEGTNRAIIDAHCNGIVTSTSLLANGYAFDHAVALARQHPTLGVGVHLTLTEGLPVSSDSTELVEANGKLPLSNQPFARALLTGRFPRDAIRREFEAQVGKVMAAGITPTHVDGHKYIHLLPGVSQIVADVAHKFGIRVMRIPHHLIDQPTRLSRVPGAAVIALLEALALRVARRADLCCSDRVAGFVDTGHLDAAVIRRLLVNPRAGVTELLCHPAYRSPALDDLLAQGYTWIAGYDFDRETAAVTSPTLRQNLSGWTFANFSCLNTGE